MDRIKHVKGFLSGENLEVETIKMGYFTIDNFILGVRRKEIALFASLPGVGKTAMLLNLAINMANSENPVLFITYETTARKIAEKFLGILAGIDPSVIEKDNMLEKLKQRGDSVPQTDDYFTRLSEAVKTLSNLPVYISEQFMFKPDILKGEIEEIKGAYIKAIFIDSLQFVQYSTQKNAKERDIENIMLFKNFARENDISILISSQISSKDIPQGKAPRLTDMGGEEELADMVFILHRPYAYSMDQYVGDTEEFVIQLAKNRNGPSGVFKLMFSRRSLRIEERKFESF